MTNIKNFNQQFQDIPNIIFQTPNYQSPIDNYPSTQESEMLKSLALTQQATFSIEELYYKQTKKKIKTKRLEKKKSVCEQVQEALLPNLLATEYYSVCCMHNVMNMRNMLKKLKSKL